ncbi:N-formylglutamate amidohydrolase [Pseudohalocynthiibacter aestuariivivens]|jgi:predicted N-formylglutamate amidohydrolase|uniref:N-formylglutamate amidohydrolase n=1 Tax=Pseudohalocynthiibacter aestuariivivens TaxID=1591409 RepID=A0ABV5JE48_9RHOB|nr:MULTISPECIES: N-formylglutamate amidohydrolase [Pseudohalocynthiibacter]MBS9718765.1 N-formylglutamate amidohydrolase [Pseudohalocynthiibacter aestuariivivens]MCK0104505.1 N-formylglutamate amidohydrolase [Pseudohalocynthiibacter sp. F2068]
MSLVHFDVTDTQLLGPDDPAPVEVVNAEATHPVLLVCEHAGQALPKRLGDLGISTEALDSHIGWDIGAEGVTRRIAHILGAPAVLQRYSRLVIDCNRPTGAPDAIPEISDGISIPGNSLLDAQSRNARVQEIFDPFQDVVSKQLSSFPRRATFSIHSFTRSMSGVNRPWDIGFLYRRDTRTSECLAKFVADARPELKIGMNQPYQIDDVSDWFVPNHGEACGLSHSLIEIRNDHIETSEGQAFWAEILSDAFDRLLKEI